MSIADEHGLPEGTPEKEAAAQPRQESAAARTNDASSVLQCTPSEQVPEPDHDATVAFLKWKLPDGRWALAWIDPEVGGPPTVRTFRGEEDAGLRPWLREQHEKRRGLYLHPNPLLHDVSKKATEAEVAAVVDLHLDVDPVGGTDLANAQANIRGALEEHLGLPAATTTVFSGGGYQAYWRLDEPFVTSGDVARIDEAKLRNKNIALHFGGGDRCQSLEHLLRLPGSVNFPGPKKRLRGQRPELVQVVDGPHADRVYDIAQFAKAEQPNAQAGSDAGAARPLEFDRSKVGGKVELPEDLHVAAKRLVVEGCEKAELLRIVELDLLGDRPEHKIREWIAKDSRNEAQHFATIEMLRRGMTREQVLTVLTSDEFGISRSIKTKGGRVRRGWSRYAEKRVRDAENALAADQPAPDGEQRPEVEIPTDRNPDCDVARALGKVLCGRGFYNYGGTLTYLRRGRLHAPSDTEAVTVFQRQVQFFAWRRKQGPKEEYEKVPKRLAPQHAKILRVAPDLLDELPPIHAVYDVPILLPDRSVATGYRDGIYCYGEPPPDVPFDAAKAALLNLVRDFMPATAHDAARLVFSYIQPALQFGTLLGPRVNFPVTIYEADDSQAGKGTAAETRAAIYGSKPYNITQHEGGVGGIREEMSRAYVEGHPFVCLQNWKGKLDSAGLESGITDGSFNARLPGGRQVTVDPSSRDHSMTVNGAQTTVDFAKRSSVVRLRLRPDNHQWFAWPEGKRAIKQHVKNRASYYLGCVYAIAREWMRRDRPVNDVRGHDFAQWAGTAHFFCTELLGLADPIADLRSIQRRISTGNANWARDLVLTISSVKMLGAELSANQLVDLLHRAGVEVPGVRPGDDIADQAVRDNAMRSVGRALGLVFATAEAHQSGGTTVAEVLVDEHRLRRISRPRSDDRTKLDKRYVVLAPGDEEPERRAPPF